MRRICFYLCKRTQIKSTKGWGSKITYEKVAKHIHTNLNTRQLTTWLCYNKAKLAISLVRFSPNHNFQRKRKCYAELHLIFMLRHVCLTVMKKWNANDENYAYALNKHTLLVAACISKSRTLNKLFILI